MKELRTLFIVLRNLTIAFVILTSPIWGFMLLMMYSSTYGPGRGDYPAVAPDADFATRRAWGQKEMFNYFTLTEKWVRASSLIAEDVGAVTGVAPIGFPNRFYAGGFTDGSHCAMNLQVIGEKGEGLLTLPEVNVNSMLDLYGIDEESSWNFEGQSDIIVLSGKSWLQEAGFQSQVEQIRDRAALGDHETVVSICQQLLEAVDQFQGNDICKPAVQYTTTPNRYAKLPYIYQFELLKQNARSLDQLGRTKEACKAYLEEATTHLSFAESFRYHYGNRRDEKDQTASLEAARVATGWALKRAPEDENLLDVARQRTIMAREFDCGTFGYSFDDMPIDFQREAVKRLLGEFYDCVVYRAKQSKWLQQQLGSMKFQPVVNLHQPLKINDHGLYKAYVVVEITGSWGKRGKLAMWIRENEKKHEPVDLFRTTPLAPSFPTTHRRVTWTDASGKKTKLAAKTLAPYEKKTPRAIAN